MTQLDLAIPESVFSATPAFKRLARQQLAADYGIRSVRALAKMLGSEWNQQMTFYRAAILSAIHGEAHKAGTSADVFFAMRNMNRRQAFRLLSTFPIPMIEYAPPDLKENELGKEHELWFATAVWILMKEFELQADFEEVAKDYFQCYKLRSKLSMARFELIEQLISHRVFNRDLFPRAGFLWLLSEAAICRRRVYTIDVPHNKREYCQRQGRYIFEMKSKSSELQFEVLSSFVDELTFFDKVVEAAAYDFMRSNKKMTSEFRRIYAEYFTAKRQWNTAESKPEMKPIRNTGQRNRHKPANVKKY